MNVDVQVKVAAEALDKVDRASLCRVTGDPSLLDPVCRDATVGDAEHPPHDLGTICEQKAQRIRNADLTPESVEPILVRKELRKPVDDFLMRASRKAG